MTQMLSMTMAVVTMTFQVARMRRLATTIQAPRRTTVLASKMTSAEFAAVTASLKAHAIAMETYWMPWVNVEDPVLPTSMRMAFAMISSNRVARILLLAITMKARQKTTAPAITVPVAK
jgi:hypothetical protein